MVHQESKVRRNVAKLFDSLAALTNGPLINAKVLPALITLASDSDINVKRITVRGFGNLVTVVEDKQVIEKINVLLTQFIEDQPKYRVILEIVKTFALITPRVSQAYRDAFIVKKLVSLAKYASEYDEDSKKQKELAECLFKAFRALYGSTIPKEVVRESLLPGLKYLEKTIEIVGNEVKAQLIQMITNLEAITKDQPLPSAAAAGATPMSPGSSDQPVTNATQTFMNIFNYQSWQMPTWELGAMVPPGTKAGPAGPAARPGPGAAAAASAAPPSTPQK